MNGLSVKLKLVYITNLLLNVLIFRFVRSMETIRILSGVFSSGKKHSIQLQTTIFL
jgi:hypothetical protein